MAEAASLQGGRDADLARLIRFLGNCSCMVHEDGPSLHLVHPQQPERRFPRAAVTRAAGLGLVRLGQGRLCATHEARSWLRRHLAAREEAFLDQHRTVDVVEVETGSETAFVRINASESPLGAVARLTDRTGKPWLGPEAIAAGERLARDFQFAALQPKVTQSFRPRVDADRARPSGAELSDNVLAARARVNAAIEALGADLSGVALDICCFEKGLETVERERQWPARSAKLMLRTALMQLHRHYTPPAGPVRKRAHVWRADSSFTSPLVGEDTQAERTK